MKVSVKLRQHDLLNNEEHVLVDCAGLLNGERLLYPESKGIMQTITFGEDEVILERKADVISHTELRKRGRGRSYIDSEYGRLEFETELTRYEKNDNFRLVEYRVYAGNEPVLNQILIWEIEKIS